MACRAATISFRVDRGSEAVEIEASAVLRADASTAWRVLTDYGRYADFIPDVRASRVISRRWPGQPSLCWLISRAKTQL